MAIDKLSSSTLFLLNGIQSKGRTTLSKVNGVDLKTAYTFRQDTS